MKVLFDLQDFELDRSAGRFCFCNFTDFFVHQSAADGRFVGDSAAARIRFRGTDQVVSLRFFVPFLNGHMRADEDHTAALLFCDNGRIAQDCFEFLDTSF